MGHIDRDPDSAFFKISWSEILKEWKGEVGGKCSILMGKEQGI